MAEPEEARAAPFLGGGGGMMPSSRWLIVFDIVVPKSSQEEFSMKKIYIFSEGYEIFR
jgi:hypothetical protein